MELVSWKFWGTGGTWKSWKSWKSWNECGEWLQILSFTRLFKQDCSLDTCVQKQLL